MYVRAHTCTYILGEYIYEVNVCLTRISNCYYSSLCARRRQCRTVTKTANKSCTPLVLNAALTLPIDTAYSATLWTLMHCEKTKVPQRPRRVGTAPKGRPLTPAGRLAQLIACRVLPGLTASASPKAVVVR